MIRTLMRALGPEHSGGLRRLVVLLTFTAVLQGATIVALVPLLRALLGPDPATAWGPLAAFGAAGLAHLAVAFVAQNAGFRVGSEVARRLHHRLGEAIAALPLGWFTPGRVGELARLNSQSVLQVMSLPAHQLRPLSTAVLTPATVLVGMYVVDVRLGLAITVASPVLLAVLVASNRIVARSDRGRDAVIHEAAARVVEFAQAQPVLRAFGRTAEGHRMLDDALVAQRDADRRMIGLAVPGLVSFAFAVRALFTALLLLTVFFALGGSLDAPTALAVLVLSVRFTESIGTAAELGASLRMSGNALSRITDVLDTAPLPEPDRPRRPGRHDVEFDAVRFGYDPPRPCCARSPSRFPSAASPPWSARPGRARPRSPGCWPGSSTPTQGPSASAAWTSARSRVRT